MNLFTKKLEHINTSWDLNYTLLCPCSANTLPCPGVSLGPKAWTSRSARARLVV